MRFKEYLLESRGIHFFDIDETLFKTKAKVYVLNKDTGEIIKKLSNQEFNTYQLNQNEIYDFREFKDSKLFTKTSEPIGTMIAKLKAIFKNASKNGSEIYLLTARQDFDNKEKLLQYFRGLGIDVGHKNEGKIHIIRAGNTAVSKGLKSAEAKKEVINNFVKTNKYSRIRLYDDDKTNLDKFLELKNDYPNYKFEAYLVKDAKAKTYKG